MEPKGMSEKKGDRRWSGQEPDCAGHGQHLFRKHWNLSGELTDLTHIFKRSLAALWRLNWKGSKVIKQGEWVRLLDYRMLGF